MSFKPRYILAEEAEERIVALYRKERGDATEIFNTAIDACQNIILDMYDNAPAEVEPVKRGKWIYDNQFHWYRASCSECGYKRVTDIKAEKWNGWKYCPNCGAKMEPISASSENGQEVEE